MKARDAVGKKIVAVRQNRFWHDDFKTWVVELSEIVLEDGTVLYPTVVECVGDYAVKLHAVKRKREAAP